MKKKYIKDNNRVRSCDANIIKMNPFEYCYYNIFHWSFFQNRIDRLFEQLIEGIKNLFFFLINIFITIFHIIFMPIFAYFEIKKIKKRY